MTIEVTKPIKPEVSNDFWLTLDGVLGFIAEQRLLAPGSYRMVSGVIESLKRRTKDEICELNEYDTVQALCLNCGRAFSFNNADMAYHDCRVYR